MRMSLAGFRITTLDIALRQATLMDMHIIIQHAVHSCGKRLATVDAVPAHAVGIQIMVGQRSVGSAQDRVT